MPHHKHFQIPAFPHTMVEHQAGASYFRTAACTLVLLLLAGCMSSPGAAPEPTTEPDLEPAPGRPVNEDEPMGTLEWHNESRRVLMKSTSATVCRGTQDSVFDVLAEGEYTFPMLDVPTLENATVTANWTPTNPTLERLFLAVIPADYDAPPDASLREFPHVEGVSPLVLSLDGQNASRVAAASPVKVIAVSLAACEGPGVVASSSPTPLYVGIDWRSRVWAAPDAQTSAE